MKKFDSIASSILKSCLIAALFFSLIPDRSFAESNGDTRLSKIETDKCAYKPGETVSFKLDLSGISAGQKLKVKYYHLADKIDEAVYDISAAGLNEFSWQWLPPQKDFNGYLALVCLIENEKAVDSISIAVDVSSDWSKFPRYGFISEYPQLTQDSVESVISNLNRHHINGLQFYDWHYKHHMPLKGTIDNPAPTWNDIANRTIYLSTIKSYINQAHLTGMKTMAYNLVYGAYSTAYMDGVKDEWGLYLDQNHQKRWAYDLPAGWAADLYFMNPANEDWKQYIYQQEAKVFKAIEFDGWHCDQVGDWGIIYDYNKNIIPVGDTFEKFLIDAKTYLNVSLVMNAVNQYGQTAIAKTPVDFLYTEVWDPNNNYIDLIRIINTNSRYSNNKLPTVLAAYVNQGLSESPNRVNTSSVLFADAVIFSAGASHIELGEHLLANPYFPNKNLSMSDTLKESLVNYYDFAVAYENLLRDSAAYKSLSLESLSGGVSLSNEQKLASIYYFAKQKENRTIIHFINFLSSKTLLWADPKGIQTKPQTVKNIKIKIPDPGKIKNVWIASPDTLLTMPLSVPFVKGEGFFEVSLPYLKYWDMLVIEHDSSLSSIENPKDNLIKENFYLGQNYPNPFNPRTTIPFATGGGDVVLRVFNVLGQEVYENILNAPSGQASVEFDGQMHSAGTYFYSLQHEDQIMTKKMNLLK